MLFRILSLVCFVLASVSLGQSPGSSPLELKTYLSHIYPASLGEIVVSEREIQLSGQVSSTINGLFLAAFPMHATSHHLSVDWVNEQAIAKPLTLKSIDVGSKQSFDVTVPRYVQVRGRKLDQLTARWRLFRRNSDGSYKPVSHGRYANRVICRSPTLPQSIPRSKKGLGGWSASREPSLTNELETLGIDSVTVNVAAIHRFVSTTPKPMHKPFVWQGRTYYANENELERMDKTFRLAEKRNATVSAILLITNPKNGASDASLLAHADVDPDAMYAMPNVVSDDGIAYYGAILNVLAERWSRQDGVHGRVHHWIVHNEVDFGWTWTNAGRKSALEYMDLYHRSMRLVHLIARQYDPHTRAWISLTHHWTDPGGPKGYGSKKMLDLLDQFCAIEGDFPWAVAFHPYPQSLFNPRTWEDEHATFHLNTKKITPKNLEVLDAYLRSPKMRYKGQVRPIQLSENGFNSKDYSKKSLNEQAAGMAWAWKKIQRLPSVQSWSYHNWVDNRHEGGLQIGLRKFRDDASNPLAPKPIWHLYQALNTETEDSVSAPYLKVIGIDSWEDALHLSPIEEDPEPKERIR